MKRSRTLIVDKAGESKPELRAVQETEARYKRLIESITDYIYTVKVENGRAVSTSHGPACLTVTGYTYGEYQADTTLWFKMVHEDDRKAVLEQSEKLLSGQTTQPLEHRIIHKSGQVRWVRNTPVIHYDNAGKIIAYDGLISDITQRKLAEEKIREHARRLEIINRVIMVANKAADLTDLLDEVLRSALELLQFHGGAVCLFDEKEQSSKLFYHRNLPEGFIKDKAQLKICVDKYQNELREGRPIFIGDYAKVDPKYSLKWNMLSLACIPLISKDKLIGSVLVVDAKLHAFSKEEEGILQAIGRQIGAAVAKMQSELALRESEERYRTISEQSLVGISIIKENQLAFVNDVWLKITGYSREEYEAGQHGALMDYIHADDRKFVKDQMRRQLSGMTEGVVPSFDYRIIAKSGETKWISSHSRSVQLAGSLVIIGVAIDITERKLSEQAVADVNRQLKSREEQLQAANQQLLTANERLAANEIVLMKTNAEKEVLLKEIHHRVKNSLQVVSSLLKLQMGHTQDKQVLDVIRASQSRIKLIAVIHEKLYQSPNLADIDIGEYIQSLTMHLFRMYLVDPGRIKINIEVDNISLSMDKVTSCGMIINELVSNSLKHAFADKKPAKIGIHLRSMEDGNLSLLVEDNGKGLPKEIDFRETVSLGLQLVMIFVEQLDGTIDLDSSRGTAFTICFPGE